MGFLFLNRFDCQKSGSCRMGHTTDEQDMKAIGINQAGPIRGYASRSQWIPSSRIEYLFREVLQIVGSYEERKLFGNVIIEIRL